MTEKLPSTGLKGIVHHWRDDLSAAVSVALVAMPLALGIALASGAPPMSGILAAIIGGVVTTFVRGSHVAINGPAAGLIVVVLTGVQTLGDDGQSGFPYVLAAIVVAGAIQVLFGLLKWGKLGDMFPISVVNGMLATIGITIIVKQFPLALGVHSSGSVFETIKNVPAIVMDLNPIVTIIALVSLTVLIVHPKLHNPFLKRLPSPLLVLVIAIPLVFLINLWADPSTRFLDKPVFIGTQDLIQIPENLIDGIMFPNFSKISHPQFWLVVISILLVASIETLISTKAVDKLDHFKRRTNLNKDLFAVGFSTMVSGFVGGLPIITVIVRSSVNVNHNAKTKWSNFYHGVLLLLFVFFFPFLINEIPQASLAAILLYTGYKLASPRVLMAAQLKGWEQLLILLITVAASLALNLLWGIIIGVLATLLIHWALSQLSLRTFLRHLVHTEVNVVEESKDTVHVEIKGIANFAIILKLINSFTHLDNEKHYIVDFARTKLVDSTVLDFIHEHREKYFTQSDFEFIGLGVHKTSSPHPLALHVLEKPLQKRLTGRQNDIYHYAQEFKYRFSPQIDWHIEHFEKFAFLEFHLFEYHRNRLSGVFQGGLNWVISDLTYTDGIMIAREEHHLTVMTIEMKEVIEDFVITKENIRQMRSHLRKAKKDGDSSNDLDQLSEYLTQNASYYIECKEGQLFLYRKERLLSTKEIVYLHDFAQKLVELLPQESSIRL